MTTLFDAINQSGVTANGATTNLSSLNKATDLFFLIGASRGKDIAHLFISALVADEDAAVRILLWARDARGGAGERSTFRNLFKVLADQKPELAKRVVKRLPELGRWDDVLEALNTPAEDIAVDMIKTALTEQHDRLAAKWMPRQGAVAAVLRAKLGYTPKAWRKLLVGLSDTVEQKMCANEWDDINYQHVPSVAAGRYQKAFARHSPDRYAQYRAALTTGEATINASAVYPYDVVRSMKNGDKDVSVAQWAALPDYLEGNASNILPVVDVSGSMETAVSGSVTAMDVAISLGLYLSERTRGAFKDTFMTFSHKPGMVKVSGDLYQRYTQMSKADWGYNTNLLAVFDCLLTAATNHKVSPDQMPSTVLIMSDMEFDSAIKDNSLTTRQNIEAMYVRAGYAVPNLVFWNIAGRAGNMPVKYDDAGTALVSGASPTIIKSILAGKRISPVEVMNETVMTPRYDY